MGIISCLHISDLHIGETINAGVESFYTQICNDIRNNQQKIDYVIFSGDIICGHSNNKDELVNNAITFFKRLLERINKTSICNKNLTEANFIFVPGNHDILRDQADIYTLYKKFLNEFYGKDLYTKLYNQEYLYTLRIDPENKIAIIGLNSCAVKRTISEKDKKWINQLSIKIEGITPTIEEKIKENLIANKIEIDDYGEISVEQLDKAFDELSENISNLNEYRIVTVFHHHIYPFPEVYTKYGDSSMIRNFAVVIDYFLSRNVSIILHGHKHTSISRPLTTNKYYNDPKKIIHVFSAGSIGSERGSKSYQIVELHSTNDSIDVQTTKYNYEGIEFQNIETITFPPTETKLVATFNITDILRTRNYDLYEQYTNQVLLKDKKSDQYKVDKIIDDISNTTTVFKDVRHYLERQPNIIFVLLLAIHYRILVHDGISTNKKMLEQIKAIFKTVLSIDEDYSNDMFELLNTLKSNQYLKKYKAIQENIMYRKHIKETAYIVATTHLLDLYLSLGFYGEIYFKREGIQGKVNFKLEDEIFNENLPTPLLKITGEEDRRTATISFNCLNPTVHKTAVLIVKDFEEKISKIEDSFKEIGLKIYYIRPKIHPIGYELENYSFEAYIPKLLPLLTGEHLYKQKEVFIRELIQNSLDAILLREKLDKSNFNKDIIITIGEIQKEDKTIKYLKIQDHGVGMDQYKIERYFTSIGRSFYTSDDYLELLQEKKITFKAVSNFGIGFLSVFMVGNSVKVLTKSYDIEKESIEMDIPNYEGCFFVKKNNSISQIGTEISLFEGDKKKINHRQIIKYFKDNILNLDLNIQLNDEIDKKNYSIERNSLFKSLIKNEDFLFIPISGEGLVDISYDQMLREIDQYQYGILIVLHGSGKSIIMNSGIKVSARTRGLKIGINDTYFDSNSPFDLYYFFPSSFIQLDVSRERILFFKSKEKDASLDKIANRLFSNQARDYIKSLKTQKSKQSINIINHLYYLFHNDEGNAIIDTEMFWVSLFLDNNNILNLSFISETDTVDENIFYMSHTKVKNEQILLNIAEKLFNNFEYQDKLFSIKRSRHNFTKINNEEYVYDPVFDFFRDLKPVKENLEKSLMGTFAQIFSESINENNKIKKNKKDNIINSKNIFRKFYYDWCYILSFEELESNNQFQFNPKNFIENLELGPF